MGQGESGAAEAGSAGNGQWAIAIAKAIGDEAINFSYSETTMKKFNLIGFCFLCCALSCTNQGEESVAKKGDSVSCMKVPSRFASDADTLSNSITAIGDTTTVGMILMPGGIFKMGGD